MSQLTTVIVTAYNSTELEQHRQEHNLGTCSQSIECPAADTITFMAVLPHQYSACDLSFELAFLQWT